MSKAGWADIRTRFFAATGMLHTTEQFSSRFRNLKKEWHFCNLLRYGGSGLGRDANGNPVAEDEWWNDNTKVIQFSVTCYLPLRRHPLSCFCLSYFFVCLQNHKSWKQFRNGLPPYLENMDRMFEHTAVDGSSSCVAAARTPVQVDSSDEDDDADEDDETTEAEQTGTPRSASTPRSNSTKRASSTSTTAHSPSKKHKSRAVRAVTTTLRSHNEIQRDRNSLFEKMLRQKLEQEEAARNEHRMRIQRVYDLAEEIGITSETAPELFRAVMALVKDDTHMELFFKASPADRRFMLEEYKRVIN